MRNKLIRIMSTILFVIAIFGLTSNPHVHAAEVTYNVTDYNVCGDGKTDDTAAINQLLSKARDLSNGDTLVLNFPKGTYCISNWLRVHSNTTLKLDKDAEIYRSSPEYPILMNVGSDGSRMENNSSSGGYNLSCNISIIGGTLNGGDISNAKNTGNTVNIAHAQNIVFQGVTFKNNYGAHLLELSGVKDATISGCDFSGYRPVKASEEKIKEDSNLNTTGYTAKECIQLDYTYFNDNNENLQWCPGYYSDKTGCQNITITNNTFHDYPRGVGNHHGRESFSDISMENITISNNTFKNMYVTTPNNKRLNEYAILLHSFKNAKVENNIIDNAGSGILMAYDENSTISNNTMSNLKSTGIIVIKESSGSTISGNILSDIPRYGISITGIANVASFANNVLSSGENSISMINGITINGAKAYIDTISGNQISSCTQFGISILNSKKVKAVSGNNFSECKKASICVSKSTCGTITENTLKGMKNSNSLLVAHGSTVTSIDNNTITNSGKNGISVGGKSKVSTINSNTISSAAGNGICLYQSAKVDSVNKNIISKTRIGISILNSICNKVNENSITNSKNFGICSTTSTVKYVQKNRITTAKKSGILFCKKSRGIKISGNKVKKAGKKKVSVDSSSKVKKY